LKNVKEAARAIGQQIRIMHESGERDLAATFMTLAQVRVGALLVGAFFGCRRDVVVRLAARRAISGEHEQREHVVAGRFMSYGTSLQLFDLGRHRSELCDRVHVAHGACRMARAPSRQFDHPPYYPRGACLTVYPLYW
jgi:hypothetical protein